jgi:hypothetical protein
MGQNQIHQRKKINTGLEQKNGGNQGKYGV